MATRRALALGGRRLGDRRWLRRFDRLSAGALGIVGGFDELSHRFEVRGFGRLGHRLRLLGPALRATTL